MDKAIAEAVELSAHETYLRLKHEAPESYQAKKAFETWKPTWLALDMKPKTAWEIG